MGDTMGDAMGDTTGERLMDGAHQNLGLLRSGGRVLRDLLGDGRAAGGEDVAADAAPVSGRSASMGPAPGQSCASDLDVADMAADFRAWSRKRWAIGGTLRESSQAMPMSRAPRTSVISR